MQIDELVIPLDQPPEQRWLALTPHRALAQELVLAFADDVAAAAGQLPEIKTWAVAALRPEHLADIQGAARILEVDPDQLLLINLYYDLLKGALGCSAFVVNTPQGNLHARNLDWWPEQLLARATVVCRFERGGAIAYQTVGWPGFVGCLSGGAPGIAITLNAVLSEDPVAAGKPVSFLIREVLEDEVPFVEASAILQSSKLCCDCLLLLSGPNQDDAQVIERTPSRAATRSSEPFGLVVTNDYRALDASHASTRPATESLHGALEASSCGRFDRVCELLQRDEVVTPDQAFAVLADPEVRMGITAQHMVFTPRSGEVQVRLPHMIE